MYYDSEEQIIDMIEEQLDKREFEYFFKLFALYSENIISY